VNDDWACYIDSTDYREIESVIESTLEIIESNNNISKELEKILKSPIQEFPWFINDDKSRIDKLKDKATPYLSKLQELYDHKYTRIIDDRSKCFAAIYRSIEEEAEKILK